MGSNRVIRFLILSLTVFIVSSCSKLVTPNLSDLHSPDIIINAFPPGANGNVEAGKENVSSETVVNVDLGMEVMISGSAKNPGGVKLFSIEITQGTNKLFFVTSTSTPDANGKVPDLLSILGTDNAGGPGNNSMLVKMNDVTTVQVTAENYNKIQTSFTVTYIPIDKSLRGVSKTKTIFLERPIGQITYSAIFPGPDIIANGKVTALQGRNFDLWILKQGKTSIDCNDLVSNCARLDANGNLLIGGMEQIFGVETPSFPVTIAACSTNSQIERVDIVVWYTIN